MKDNIHISQQDQQPRIPRLHPHLLDGELIYRSHRAGKGS